MEEGRAVRVAIQQADGQVKLRPAVVLKRMGADRDLLVCAIPFSISWCTLDRKRMTGGEVLVRELSPFP
jgi:hypothetical protein